MKRNTRSGRLALLSAIAIGAPASFGAEAFENLIPLQIMMGAMYEETWTLAHLLGWDNTHFAMPFTLSPGNISYSIEPGTIIGGVSVSLNGWLTQTDEGTWIGGSELDMMRARKTKEYLATWHREGDLYRFEIDTKLTDDADPDPDYLHSWTLTKKDGTRDEYTSTHSTGATDMVAHRGWNKVYWEVTFPNQSSVSGTTTPRGSCTAVADAVIPAPPTLAILGLALIASRRRR